MHLPWACFADAADDGVLVSIFRLLPIVDVLSFLGTSASSAARLDDAPSGLEDRSRCGTRGCQTVIHRLLSTVLGEAVTVVLADCSQPAATCQAGDEASGEEEREQELTGVGRRARGGAAAQGEEQQQWGEQKWPPRVASVCLGGSRTAAALRALAGARPAAVALRLALGLARAPPRMAPRMDAGPFLDALFRAETAHRRAAAATSGTGAGCERLAAAATARAAVAGLVASHEGGHLVVLGAARALREAEHAMDALYESCSTTGHYECVARRRSAAEFLRSSLSEAAFNGGALPPAESERAVLAGALRELGAAAESLDEAIRGCSEEGFDLACTRLESGAPYAHWWLFLASSDAGKFGMCG